MRIGSRVITEYGAGIIVGSEFERDNRAFRWCVKVDNPPDQLVAMQNRQGGLYIPPCKLKPEAI